MDKAQLEEALLVLNQLPQDAEISLTCTISILGKDTVINVPTNIYSVVGQVKNQLIDLVRKGI